MKRKASLLCLFVSLVLLCLLAIIYSVKSNAPIALESGNAIEKKIQSKHFSSQNILLEDLSNQKIIYQKNSQEKIKIASLTKIMTVICVLESGEDLNEKISIPEQVINLSQRDGLATAGFSAGEEVTLLDLLYAAMLPSGADAALALAIYLSGDENSFVMNMNQKAKELQMKHTRFSNCVGIDERDNYSSVMDLQKLMYHALKNPIFEKIFTTFEHHTTPSIENSEGHLLISTVQQRKITLDLPSGRIIGAKTGYTDQAGQCLISLARIKQKKYLLINCGAKGGPDTAPYHILEAKKIFQLL